MTPAAHERRRSRIPLVAISLLAWSAVIADDRQAVILQFCRPTSWPTLSLDRLSFAVAAYLPLLIGGWLLMVAAMMTPMLGGPVSHVRARSLPHRRFRATAFFITGYCMVWIAAALPIVTMVIAIPIFFPVSIVSLAIVFAIGLAWQCSPAKQLCLNHCHSLPALDIHGLEADVSAWRFGYTQGVWCCGACWALMMIPLAMEDHHLVAMAGLCAFLSAERLDKPRRPEWSLRYPSAVFRLVRYVLARTAGRTDYSRRPHLVDHGRRRSEQVSSP